MLIEGQDLELHRKVHFAKVDVRRDVQAARCEIQHGPDAGINQTIGDFLGGCGGRRDDPDRDRLIRDLGLKLVQMENLEPAYLFTDHGLIYVEQ